MNCCCISSALGPTTASRAGSTVLLQAGGRAQCTSVCWKPPGSSATRYSLLEISGAILAHHVITHMKHRRLHLYTCDSQRTRATQHPSGLHCSSCFQAACTASPRPRACHMAYLACQLQKTVCLMYPLSICKHTSLSNAEPGPILDRSG